MNSFATTAIGSLPFKNPRQAVDINLQYLDIPCWPQLPRLSFLENMYVQFCEGLPGVVIDENNKKIYVLDEDLKSQEKFFQAVVDKQYSYFKISESYARGLYLFQEKAKGQKIVKGQITGPVSFGLSIRTKDGRAIFYDDSWREIVTRHLTMKAVWQYRFLRNIAEVVVIFIDEPYLSSIGSGFLTISESAVIESLSEVINSLQEESAIVGIHCCGNTDWRGLSRLPLDIINYDAFNYPQSLSVHPEIITSHMDKGGYVAWGIVPSGSEIENVEVEHLGQRMENMFNALENKGINIDLLRERSLLTPSCGTGTVSESQAVEVYDKLKQLSQFLRR